MFGPILCLYYRAFKWRGTLIIDIVYCEKATLGELDSVLITEVSFRGCSLCYFWEVRQRTFFRGSLLKRPITERFHCIYLVFSLSFLSLSLSILVLLTVLFPTVLARHLRSVFASNDTMKYNNSNLKNTGVLIVK